MVKECTPSKSQAKFSSLAQAQETFSSSTLETSGSLSRLLSCSKLNLVEVNALHQSLSPTPKIGLWAIRLLETSTH
jgi:hypothetical protein